MSWYYFIRNGNNIVPLKPERLPPRPKDANPDNGDPFTPWYELGDHWDEEHIHIRASSPKEAARKANDLILQKSPV